MLATLVAAILAASLASDKLAYLAALAPFLAAGLVVSRLAPRAIAPRVSFTTIAISVAALIGSRVAVDAMRDRNVVAGPYPISLTATTQPVQNALHALQSLFAIFNGGFDRQDVNARGLLALLCALVVLVAIVVAARFAYRWTSDLAVVLIVVGVVEPSTARRTAVTVAACIIALASVVSLTRDFDTSLGDEMVREVLPFVEGEGLKRGYAAYWTAVPLTWRSHMRVQVTPVVSCPLRLRHRVEHQAGLVALHTLRRRPSAAIGG